MNAERLEIARRFAACSGWVNLAGMQFTLMVGDTPIECGRIAFDGDDPWVTIFTKTHHGRDDVRDQYNIVPDLDDPLTRLGCLAVVRRARSIPHLGIWGNLSLSPGLRFTCGEANGRAIGSGPSELLAMLAALEAAPK